jgi:D-alanyl-lipoteichoic acid acyltransferase DltB (MBOAT superfamily)
MTLSRFLRDYLYFALGGNRKGKLRRHVNLMLTMLLGGLWHGASWTFVVWGGLHGAFLAVNHAWHYLRDRFAAAYGEVRSPPLSLLMQFFAGLLTFLSVVVAWVFFRAKSIDAALRMLESMVRQPLGARMSEADWHLVPWLAALMALVLLIPNSQQLIDGQVRARLPRLRTSTRHREILAFATGAEVVAIVMLALVAARRASTEFIYFNF